MHAYSKNSSGYQHPPFTVAASELLPAHESSTAKSFEKLSDVHALSLFGILRAVFTRLGTAYTNYTSSRTHVAQEWLIRTEAAGARHGMQTVPEIIASTRC